MNKPAPKVYRTTNWSSYNRALINRGNLSIWFDPTTQWYAQPKGSSAADIPTIPVELFTKFQTSFYADPVDAVFKGLGVN